MILYPKLYIENVLKIDENIIKQYKIKALLLDIDNTLIHYDKTILDGVEKWAEKMKENGIKLCILSNSNNNEKIESVASKICIPYIGFANKPLKKGFKKAIKLLNINPENIAMVGDQIFTDVIGANRMKMVSILTKPLEEKDIWVTKIKRPIENAVINKYLKKKGDNKNVLK